VELIKSKLKRTGKISQSRRLQYMVSGNNLVIITFAARYCDARCVSVCSAAYSV